ncbi:MAG: hypothetical protein KAW17_10355 [Candidatus Eisenbacteria sp.]|nr:hypothetical protein [Candidatus Eisenbacteria bacterium]
MRLSFKANAALLVAVTGVAIPALSFFVPGHIQLHLLLFFSGAGLATVLLGSGNLSEWVGLSTAASLVLFSVWTGLLWALNLPAVTVLWGAVLGTNILLVVLLSIRSRSLTLKVGYFDIAALTLWIVIRAMQLAVFSRNGVDPGMGNGEAFVARGWFARDTFYFYALVEQAVQGQGWPVWNPFFGGFEVAYPGLMHMGLAGLLVLSGERIAAASSGLMGVVLVPVVTLGLGLLKSAGRRARQGILWPIAAAFLLYALALRLDTVLYPQTQYFVLGIFLLFLRVMMTVGSGPLRGNSKSMAVGWALGLFLVLAHQVSGSAALFVWVFVAAALGRARRWVWWGWCVWAAAGLVLGLALMSGGRDPHLEWSWSGFDAYILYAWIGSLKGWLPALFFALWTGIVLGRMRLHLWAAAGLLVVTICVMVWGVLQEYGQSRIVLVFNAERYLYHGFLLVFPAVAVLFCGYWQRCCRQPRMRTVLVILMVLPFFQLPALTYKSRGLLTDEPVVVTGDMLRAYDWICSNTDIGDVILRQPVPGSLDRERFDRSLPAFTGRSLYVADIYNIWGYANIPAYEHGSRVAFVRDVSGGRYGPEALSRACSARGIDYWITHGPRGNSDPVLENRWFDVVYNVGSVSILKPITQKTGEVAQ